MHFTACRQLLAQRLAKLEHQTVDALIRTMIAFYRDTRFDDVDMDELGDGLLLQWGTGDWGLGDGRRFELNITRQLSIPEDDEPFQLQLTMIFLPGVALDATGSAAEWCFSLADLPAFEAYWEASAPYAALRDAEPPLLQLWFEQC